MTTSTTSKRRRVTNPRGNPEPIRMHIGTRMAAAHRSIHRWRTTYPPLPRTQREALAAELLAEPYGETSGADQ